VIARQTVGEGLGGRLKVSNVEVQEVRGVTFFQENVGFRDTPVEDVVVRA